MIVHRTTGGNGKENWLAADLNKGRLDMFYYLNVVMTGVNLLYFIICAKWYRYKDLKSGTEEILIERNKPSNEPLV
ncbi:hypothetical protein IEQ34_011546 [Dendrobium chrysotoxum]|uniref:Uncharacterized protein n=1 Tax=Dendrobium chrysotoxum TaxID=161865 RepID=A0AAV7GT63_DENCH|nr:hypothetical protein IEQ34_011546 [Dendrobium chrysotoxum]